MIERMLRMGGLGANEDSECTVSAATAAGEKGDTVLTPTPESQHPLTFEYACSAGLSVSDSFSDQAFAVENPGQSVNFFNLF